MSYIISVTIFILKGSILTFELCLATAEVSIILGIMGALGKISGFSLLKKFLEIYTWVFRGTPLLLQLFFAYYGLPVLGITLTPFMAATLTFIINYGAYLTEIFRAGIESIDKGSMKLPMYWA